MEAHAKLVDFSFVKKSKKKILWRQTLNVAVVVKLNFSESDPACCAGTTIIFN